MREGAPSLNIDWKELSRIDFFKEDKEDLKEAFPENDRIEDIENKNNSVQI